MKTIKHTSTFFIWVSAIGFALFLFDSTGILTLRMGDARPILLIPLLLADAMAAREWIGLIYGAVFGILLDTTGYESFCFNMIMLVIIGCLCGLLCSFYVNDNIYAAIVLSFIANLFYFVVRWFFFFVCAGRGESLIYFTRYSFPTIIYNTVFIVPFYFLIKYISKKTSYFD